MHTLKHTGLGIAIAIVIALAGWGVLQIVTDGTDERIKCFWDCDDYAPIMIDDRCYCDTTKRRPRDV